MKKLLPPPIKSGNPAIDNANELIRRALLDLYDEVQAVSDLNSDNTDAINTITGGSSFITISGSQEETLVHAMALSRLRV